MVEGQQAPSVQDPGSTRRTLSVRQAAFIDFAAANGSPLGAELAPLQRGKAAQRPAPLQQRLTDDDARAHSAFVETLGEKAIWWRFLAPAPTDA